MDQKPPGTRPYEVIGYAALAAVLLIQLSDDLPLSGLLAFACGLAAMMGKLPLGPIFYLILVAGSQLIQNSQGIEPRNSFRPAWLDVRDIAVCMGVLAFVAVHYRLQGIWFHHLALDPRRRADRNMVPLKSFRLFIGRFSRPADPRRRTPEHITQEEISWLILSLPIWALLAQIMTLWIPQVQIPNVAPWFTRVLAVSWALGLGSFIMVNLLALWRHFGMGRMAARLFLQDVVWRESRGEQRQLQRWLAWKRMLRKS